MKEHLPWFASLAILVVVFGTIYGAVQQSQRSDANSPQIQIAEDTLLDIAYKKSQKRALIPNYEYLRFNEVIIHALIPYYNNISGDQNIDKLIAKIYKNDPHRLFIEMR